MGLRPLIAEHMVFHIADRYCPQCTGFFRNLDVGLIASGVWSLRGRQLCVDADRYLQMCTPVELIEWSASSSVRDATCLGIEFIRSANASPDRSGQAGPWSARCGGRREGVGVLLSAAEGLHHAIEADELVDHDSHDRSV